jgi:hypothetical protein
LAAGFKKGKLMVRAGQRNGAQWARARKFLAPLGLAFCLAASPAVAENILFVGNSFTFAAGTPVMTFKAKFVTDLNRNGTGGVPALFKLFTLQAGLDYDVYLETHPGAGIDWHLAHKLPEIGSKRWQTVVLQSYSTLDERHPGNGTLLARSARRMAEHVRNANPDATVKLVATWSRADQTYQKSGHWYGKPIDAMANDLRAAYDTAAAGARASVIPVGESWSRAIRAGFADANPYDGIDAGKVNLWGDDHYHASIHGYYLEALAIFGSVTGVDPRSLGANECAGVELGVSPEQIRALEQIAFDQLAASGTVTAARAIKPADCASLR